MGFSKYAMSAGVALFLALSTTAQDEGQGVFGRAISNVFRTVNLLRNVHQQ